MAAVPSATKIEEEKEVVNETPSSEPDKSENVSTEEPDNPLLPGDDSQPVGLITESGEINWDCPCLQGMADGPCGTEFKDAFSCFHYSEEEPKGANCIEQFTAMQKCFLQYPEVYGGLDDDLEEESAPTEVKDESEIVPEENTNADESAKSDDKIDNVTEKLENTSLPES